jgi:hypothetical protein
MRWCDDRAMIGRGEQNIGDLESKHAFENYEWSRVWWSCYGAIT